MLLPKTYRATASKLAGSIPGSTTYDPTRYTSTNKIVVMIRLRRSSIFQMFFIVSIALIVLEFDYCSTCGNDSSFGCFGKCVGTDFQFSRKSSFTKNFH